MKNAVNLYHLARIFIENRIGKSSQQCPSIVVIHFSVNFPGATNLLDACVDAGKKILAQSMPTILVPVLCLADVQLRFRCQNQISGHIDS